MAPPSPPAAPAPRRPFEQPRALRDLLVVGSPIVLLGAAGNAVGLETLTGGALVNLGYVGMLVLGSMLLARQQTDWRALGLRRPRRVLGTLALGMAAFVGAVVVFVLAQNLAAYAAVSLGLPPAAIDESRFDALTDNLPFFLLLLTLAWTTIAFGEELFYRAFVLTRLVDVAGMPSGIAILIAGALFGGVHFAEGPVGIFSNGAFGVLFGWIYLRSGRNVWITIVGHGLLNTLRFVLLYLGAV